MEDEYEAGDALASEGGAWSSKMLLMTFLACQVYFTSSLGSPARPARGACCGQVVRALVGLVRRRQIRLQRVGLASPVGQGLDPAALSRLKFARLEVRRVSRSDGIGRHRVEHGPYTDKGGRSSDHRADADRSNVASCTFASHSWLLNASQAAGSVPSLARHHIKKNPSRDIYDGSGPEVAFPHLDPGEQVSSITTVVT